MGKFRKEWVEAKSKFEGRDVPGVDMKKYLSKKDLGPLLDKAEAASKALGDKDDAKTAKAAFDAIDAAIVVAASYEAEIKFLVKEVGRKDAALADKIDKAGKVLASIAMRMTNMREEAKLKARTAGGDNKNAPVRKGVEKGIVAAAAAVKKCAADPSATVWNAVVPPGLAPLIKAMELSRRMTDDLAPAFKKHMVKLDGNTGPDMDRKLVLTNLKDIQDNLANVAKKLDAYLPKK